MWQRIMLGVALAALSAILFFPFPLWLAVVMMSGALVCASFVLVVQLRRRSQERSQGD